MGTLPKRGEIGIRSAWNHSTLWFHLPITIASDPDLNTTGFDELSPGTDRPALWDGLTKQGCIIVRGIWELDGVAQIMLRPTYVSVTIEAQNMAAEADVDKEWERLIPRIVAVIRMVVGPSARIYRREPPDRSTPQWYVPLVERLAL